MVNGKIWGIFTVVALAFILQGVSASAKQVYFYDSPHATYWYNPNTDYGGTEFSIGEKIYAPVNVGYTNTQRYNPRYNSYGYYDGYNYPRYDNYYWKDERAYLDRASSRAERQKVKAVKWVVDSFNTRYEESAGKTSGEAFYYDYPKEGEEIKVSNFRNKPAYDPLVDGIDSKNDFYYKPKYDYESQSYNWRF